MNIAVIGAGSLGAVYGARLAMSGQDVTLIDIDEEHVDSINQNGLQFEHDGETTSIPILATTDASAPPKADVAIILVNAYSTHEAAISARTVLKANGYAVTLQNGLGNVEELAEILGEERVMGGICYVSGTLTAPGCVTHTSGNVTHIGELDGSHSRRLQELAAVLEDAGLGPVISDDIVGSIWGKFVHNCAINAVCAITELNPAYIQDVPELDEFQTCIIKEAMNLAEASDVTLPDEDPVATIKAWAKTRYHRPSMMLHLDRGLPTEIDALNGYVASQSAKLGLAAPCNDALTRLMKGREYLPKQSD